MRTPEYIVKIAADDISRLRVVDVFRVLDDCSPEERKPMARYIVENRPDLAGEVNGYWQEVLPMEKHETDSDCVVFPDTGLCVICGVDHSDKCPVCSGSGFHKDNCPVLDGDKPEETAAGAELRQLHATLCPIDKNGDILTCGCMVATVYRLLKAN